MITTYLKGFTNYDMVIMTQREKTSNQIYCYFTEVRLLARAYLFKDAGRLHMGYSAMATVRGMNGD